MYVVVYYSYQKIKGEQDYSHSPMRSDGYEDY
nr:MAG TPA: hypothetical protein [Crassvirales sp.]